MFQQIAYSAATELFPLTVKWLVIFLPIAMPIMLIIVFWILRIRWVQMKFVEAQKTCILEIKLPKEVMKSPAGMEIFIQHLSQSGAATYGEAFIDGKTRPWFSLELVSTDGVPHLYVWCSQAKFKNLVEAQLYAQYPNLEIYEVEDYTKSFDFDLKKRFCWGIQWALTKPDPYPIKTYIDYGLDSDPKDEYKIDPLTAVIEFLGAIKKGENVWIQILIQKHEDEGWKHGRFMKKLDWKEDIKTEIEKIREQATPKPKKGEETSFAFPNPTKGQVETISAIERSAGKMPFDAMVRGFYVADWAVFNPTNISILIGILKQFSSNSLNGFKLGTKTDVSDNHKDWVRLVFPFLTGWQDRKSAELKREMFHAYKLRSYFQWPYRFYGKKPYVLNVEELATLFHFPSGITSQTPTLTRVASKKSEAPANLPI
jgi:hypothetical protein